MKFPKPRKGVATTAPPKTPPFVPRPPRSQASIPKKAPPPSRPPLPIRDTSIKFESTPTPSPTPPLRAPSQPRLTTAQRREELEALKRQARVTRWRQWPILVCGLAAFGIGVYSMQLWISLNRAPPASQIPYDLSDRFDKEADGYDEKVNTAEKMLRLTSKRKEIMKRAHGHVLENAVGTGRNIPYYQTKQCETVTLLDSSGPMLAVAKRKWNDTHPEYFHRVFFKQQSALDPITPPYGAQDGYDTVIQTMGLCSTPEPVRLLHNLEAATKEDGEILLLEHGKSYYEWLNNLLDKTAPAHADEHGCWWNKDIGRIVEDSGMEVVDIRRYNFGTTWWVELRPRKGMRNRTSEVNSERVVQEKSVMPPEPPIWQRAWWSLWR